MARVGVIVEFRIKEGQFAAFDALIREHARLTLAEEPGCQRFDVLQPRNGHGEPDQGRLLLCEVYADTQAFELHGSSPRLATVRERYAPLLLGRQFTLCDLD